jgi:NADPH:quinone reductase-like Zn-dependent oxidoreductase
LRLTDVPKPEPTGKQVLVKLRAVSLNRSDWEVLEGKPLYARINGLFRPRRHILGSDIAGRVEAIGPEVTRFAPGDEVFADILGHLGGFAEYVCVAEDVLERLPDGMSFDEAACLPQAGAIAVHGISGRVMPGQRVLINGGGGGAGMYAIQLAKLAGADVTAVDNAEKLEFMRSLGADHVIDYEHEDFTRRGQTYDLILDMVARRSARAYRRALAPGGLYLLAGGSTRTMASVLLSALVPGRRKLRILAVQLGAKRVAPIVELVSEGRVTTHIDRRFSLADVPEALRYLGAGHAKGKVVVTID